MNNQKSNQNLQKLVPGPAAVRDYLLGGNENLIGTVLAIRKSLKKSHLDKYFAIVNADPEGKHYLGEAFTTLIYFDHRRGRIVRHLYNPNLIFNKRNPEIIQSNLKLLGKIKKPILYNIEPALSNENPKIVVGYTDTRHVPTIENANPRLLFDGKLTKRMLSIFFLFLSTEYLRHGKLYSTTDFGSILENTDPVEFGTFLKILTVASESKMRYDSLISELSNINLFLEYPDSETTKDIYIPKGVSGIYFDKFIDLDYSLKQMSISDCPQVIKDLKSVINAKTITNNTNLSYLTNRFNEALAIKLSKMIGVK